MGRKKICENCDYEQELRADRKARRSWRCYDCNHSNKLPFVIIATILAIGSLGLVYADHPIPLESWNWHACTLTGFPLENGTIITDWKCVWSSYFDRITDEWKPLPPIENQTIPTPEGAFVILPPDERIEEIIEEPKDQMDLDFEGFLHPEEPLSFDEIQIKAAIEKLDECRTGLGAWAAFQQQGAIEFYVNQSRFTLGTGETSYEVHQLMKIKKAIEACRIMEKGARAGTVSIAHLHAYMADIAGLDYLGRSDVPARYNATDSPFTDPITEDDIKNEIKAAQEYLRNAPFMNPNLGCLPTEADPDRCVNRGGPTEGLKCQTVGQPAPIGVLAEKVCPLDSYNQSIRDNPPQTYEDTRQLLCDYYLDTYKHKYGTDDFPAWLNHCLVEDETEDVN